MAEAKKAAIKMENLDRDHTRMWRKDDELMSQFIPIRPWVVAEKPEKYESHTQYTLVDAGPHPLAVREPTLHLALPAPRVDPHIEGVE